MKTKVIMIAALALICGQATMAQTKTTFGIRGGVNFQNLNGKDQNGDRIDGKLRTGFHVGANAEIPVGIDFYLQPGVLFSTKGAKAKDIVETSLSYIEVPVNFVYKPDLGTGRVLLGFGPYLGIGVGGQYKVGNVEGDVEFGNETGQVKRLDAGASMLAGYEWSNKVSVQLNAALGLVNLHNRVANDNKSSLKNTGFGLSVGYRF
ncbi:MAG: PorT family protein [Chitinophagaceae bacterium]|nr:PorT family protein [Chitinophagaceae bacterium]